MKKQVKMNNSLDKELGIVQEQEIPWDADENQIVPYKPPLSDEEDIENDYKYQRENFYNLVEKGSTAIDGILELAKESEHPRTYEVAGNLIKQVAEVT